MKLKHIIITVVAIVVLLVVLKLAGVIGGDKTEKVTTEKASDKTVVETVTASGKIQPETEVKLSSEVSGEVVELKVKEGDIVKAGQLLCKVRPDVLQSGYERTVASFNAQKARGNSQLMFCNLSIDSVRLIIKCYMLFKAMITMKMNIMPGRNP